MEDMIQHLEVDGVFHQIVIIEGFHVELDLNQFMEDNANKLRIFLKGVHMEKEVKKFMTLIMISMIIILVGVVFSFAYYKPVNEEVVEKVEVKEEKIEEKIEKQYKIEVKDGNTYVEGLIVVNKAYPLSTRTFDEDNPEAKEKLMQLIQKMQELNFDVSFDYGGIRSFDTQDATYQKALEIYKDKVDLYEAKAGNSERETGFTFDLYDSAINPLQEKNTIEWLNQHAHEYGFIIRLPKDKESSTGFLGKENRIRYVGKWAKEIYESKLSFEEFFKLNSGVNP